MKSTTVADLLRAWRGRLRIVADGRLVGAKRALFCGDSLVVSPAMYALLGCDDVDDDASVPDEMREMGEGIPLVYVECLRHEYRVAFSPD